jgi:hypothetical protein
LSELLDAVEAEPVQDELPEVRVLFELLGFLLTTLSAISCQLSLTPIWLGCGRCAIPHLTPLLASVYN